MNTDFKDVMSKRTDEQLIKIVTVDRDDYQPAAVIAAEEEIRNRNLDTAKVEQVESEIKAEIEIKKQNDDNTARSLIRFVNFNIDLIICWIIIYVLALILSIIGLYQNFVGFILVIATFICYYHFMESTFQKTVGKFVTKTKVVTNDGNKPTNSDIFRRTLCRFVPLDQFSFLFTRNGFHDRLSDTKVIRDKS